MLPIDPQLKSICICARQMPYRIPHISCFIFMLLHGNKAVDDLMLFFLDQFSFYTYNYNMASHTIYLPKKEMLHGTSEVNTQVILTNSSVGVIRDVKLPSSFLVLFSFFFSSPEPKALGELIV